MAKSNKPEHERMCYTLYWAQDKRLDDGIKLRAVSRPAAVKEALAIAKLEAWAEWVVHIFDPRKQIHSLYTSAQYRRYMTTKKSPHAKK